MSIRSVITPVVPTPEEQARLDQTPVINDIRVEQQWAMKAVKYAEVHMNLLKAMSPRKMDAEIYEAFRKAFPKLKVDVLHEEEMKSEAGKAKWRPVLLQFKEKFKDWDMGTLLRLDGTKEFSPENSTIVPRIQFLCIEIARNKEGINDSFYTPPASS